MKKQVIFLIAFLALAMNLPSLAHEDFHPNHKPKPPTHKQIKEFDNYLDSRLNLTKEQKELLKENRNKHDKKMRKIVSKMQNLHDKIRNVYLTGIPPFQVELRTAPYKAELVVLNQQAKKLREDSRKEFEAILNQEQKIEFEKIKKEIAHKRQNHNNKKESP